MHRWLICSFLTLCACVVPAVALEREDYLFGTSFTAEEVESLEERLEAGPGDVKVRTHLIVYYFGRFSDSEARHARHKHALWLIRNAPEAGVLGSPEGKIDAHFSASGYVAGRDAWLRNIDREPTNVTFLDHAANYFAVSQDRELAIEFIREAQRLDPQNREWPRRLGHAYWRQAVYAASDAKKAMAKQALEQFLRAYELSDHGSGKAYLLNGLGKAAMAAERYDDARTYAKEILEYAQQNNFGEGFHHGNLILGILALIENDIEKAKYHLLKAGRTPGSATLGSFGPSMDLALQLLRHGERDVVLEYFELCSKFWPREELKEWTAMVRGGEIPDFRFHLKY